MNGEEEHIPIAVILVDDQHVAREGTRSVLKEAPDITLLASTARGREALELVQKHSPDVLITEMALPDISGIQIATELSRNKLHVPVLAFSAYADETFVSHTLKNGLAGYVMKQDPPELLFEAIRAIATGNREWMSARVVRNVLKQEYKDGNSPAD